ncbi:hypothetical protein BC939DRAFT_462636 [Gamsiella multidivaricata]|uniref:uncharacterized protein n=1 Tax=Gamsiella multidivaricata TaxID=101098 RepID=UPI00221E3C71|nr:uncharacterized protein BC939DRAFT_462636 [Gamsiella multidivaricata]KAG0354761.1 hypothetical protein BGZ54_001485 [Gamsiella multidivaricata]KAI7818599.1 hypothetical protein BC939DRAFT_462636 [Gamsiella multidivaricata]
MAQDDHEQTPLLQDQDEYDHSTETTTQVQDQDQDQAQDQVQAQSEDLSDRAQDFVNNIRNVFENQIPNGHQHPTPPSSPKKIYALLPRLFGLINALVDSVNVDDDIVTDEVIEFLAGLGKEVIYGLLRCVEGFMEEGQRNVGRKKLMERRSEIAQLAAAGVTKVFVDKDMMATYCHVLTRPYYAAGEERNTAEGAIELAVRLHATDFLADVEVQRCVQALWNGLILQTEDEECRVRFVEYSGVRRSRHLLWEWIDVGRLNVPKYQNNMKIAMFVLFLIMYTIVVNDRTAYPTPVEWAVNIFVCGYIFEEFRLIFEGGTAFFLGSLWHWINIISYGIFLVSFAFRFTGCFLGGDAASDGYYSNIAYDLLGLLAIFFWFKPLSLLDGFQYFGTMVMVLQKMLKDGIMFFWLLTWVFIGFLQTFYALQKDEVKSFQNTYMLLIRGFLQDPDWELAQSLDRDYGSWVFALYLFLTGIILLNLLIALFNSSYTNITDSAEKEYMALFTFKVFSYLKSPDQFPFAAPFNLIEVFFIIPWSLVVSRKAYESLNRCVMSVLFCVPILFIARTERRRYLKLRNSNEENEIQGGRRTYRHLTEDDNNVDDMFLLATQQFDHDEEEVVAGSSETAAAISQAEEGVIKAAANDAFASSLSPMETFEEFRARRAMEKEAKAKTTIKAADSHLAALGKTTRPAFSTQETQDDGEEGRSRQSTSRTAVGSNAQESGLSPVSGQLSDIVVQSLLASLARMESRQKDIEKLLESYTEKDKEKKVLTAAVRAAAETVELQEPEEEQDEEDEENEEEQ